MFVLFLKNHCWVQVILKRKENNMEFDKEKYMQCLMDGKFGDAHKYKNETAPKTIYKYESLGRDSCLDTSLDSKKLCSLKNNEIWFSKFDALNDPLEYKSIYINYERLGELNYPITNVKKLFDHVKNTFLIASFSNNELDNMPMWTHYSNAHQGYCMEYTVNNPYWIYPIIYESIREEITNIFSRFYTQFEDYCVGATTVKDLKHQQTIALLYTAAAVKDISWEHEDEYRLIFRDNISGSGKNILSSEVGIQISSIYFGYKCSEKNKIKIAEIARGLGIDVYETYIDDKKTDFVLGHKPYSGT